MRIDTLSIDTLVVGVLVLLAMVGISVYGWRTLPPDARVPLHRGPGGFGNWQPKARALITYPVGGAVVFAIVLTATTSGKSGKTTPLVVIAPLAILAIFFAQYFAVMAAIRNAGRND
jgi:hypothetical protein